MSGQQGEIELIAAVYPNMAEAQATLNDLVRMHKADAIQLIDAAVMIRDADGNLSITERAELTPGKGAKRGALIGAALAVIFPPSLLASAALGAAAGAVTGKVTDQGFENDLLEELAENLEPGKSAILAVVEHTWLERMMDAVDGYDRILERGLTADEAGSIRLRD
ncbi:MAG: DUF1269 domain-containing protein [Acidimicrobiia bacterium]